MSPDQRGVNIIKRKKKKQKTKKTGRKQANMYKSLVT